MSTGVWLKNSFCQTLYNPCSSKILSVVRRSQRPVLSYIDYLGVPLANESDISLIILPCSNNQAHYRHTLQTHTTDTLQTHTTDTHYSHTLQTRTTDTHYRHALQTHTTDTTDTHCRYTLQTHTTDTFLFISHTTNVLLFKFRCNIFIGVRIFKETPGSVESGTPCVLYNIIVVLYLYRLYVP